MNIAIIQGHPDPAGGHFGHALADAYAEAAAAGGHALRRIAVAQLEFPVLRTQQDWQEGEAPPAIREAQEAIAWADHLLIVFPLWLGDMPALVKAFFEQLMRPGFAIGKSKGPSLWKELLKGRSARVVVTMGMPAFFYRVVYRAHSVKSLERNILNFCGIAPVRTTLIGTVEAKRRGVREDWLARMRKYGKDAK
jgi:putative NADPH-quinone reductase